MVIRDMAELHHHRPVAIVTGASMGLGRALSAALVEEGWAVIGDGRRPDPLNDVARELGPAFHAVVGDITDAGHRQELVALAGRLDGLDLLVNNASTLGPAPMPRLADLHPDDLIAVLTANVVAPHALSTAALPLLRSAGGTIINVTSDASIEAYEGWGAYGVSKAALDHLSRILAAEESEVRVLAVDPGDMRTEMHQAAFPGEDISDRPEPEASVPGILALLSGSAPSGRHLAREVLAR
jgi:NAD(P)-dependent dehydrogenase (short-subunit alcohol dehydrogenase family)